MANFRFDVNTAGIIHLTDRLERLNRSAFPSAVRSTLSDAAFEMKQKNILESAKRNLTVRNKTVFKKFTGVERAKFNRNIESMQATVGFVPKDGVKGSKVPDGMEANEVGGVDTKGWMYNNDSRISKDKTRLVRRNSRYKKSNILNVRRARSIATKKALDFFGYAYESFNQKKAFHLRTKKGLVLAQATSFKDDSSGIPSVKLEFLMRSRKDFNAKAKATHFVKEGAIKTQKQIEGFYQKNAEFQFQKVWK